MASAGIRHSTVNGLRVRFAGGRRHHVLRHREFARLQPLLQPRLRVLVERGRDRRARTPPRRPARPPAARRRSRRRRTPRRTPPPAHRRGSTAARPPLFQHRLAQPHLVDDPEPPREARQRVADRRGWRARARARLRECPETARTARRRRRNSSTASPMNSSRSLWAAPKLRWVSACASSSGRRNAWPRRSRNEGDGILTRSRYRCRRASREGRRAASARVTSSPTLRIRGTG